MKDSIAAKLANLDLRLKEIDHRLSDPAVVNDLDDYRKLSQERAEIEPVVAAFNEYRKAEGDVAAAEDMAKDPSMREFAEAEVKEGRARIEKLEADLQAMLLPRDPNDEKNLFLEVRGGTGGDESALFAGDLFRMYVRFAERNRWQVEILSESAGDAGGYKEVIARIVGRGAYSKLKFESGGHRVQRVPATETQGRIHTSAATVAVMAEADDASDVVVNPADVRVDTYRASGAGGQHVNKTDSAVRLTHVPTGIVVECQDGRSQHKNKEQAWRILAARIKDKQQREQQAKEASERKGLIGTGDRSDRIRTYNFPQGRVTDHRINLTLHQIEKIMDGDMDDLIGALAAEHQADQLAGLSDSAA
ncbi:peptide chain release factor 1 [Usitatibacter palustris]|uniref:Peptide chain release factor 1 n=1 Tax=Usitatibacter palustris TaxID=2732487 RepID=A0A6M4H6M7_9PROT|nr:peptide chain release factor 1 [Usitatibacter palustris]QJR13607.1 Peptide chain release factor RF1 [Usitatibacter palustris]